MHDAIRRSPITAALVAALTATSALAAQAGTAPSHVATGSAAQDETPAVEFANLTFDDAISRAERLDKLLVVLWVKGPDDPQTLAFRSAVFDDVGVRRWIAANATAVRIDAKVDKKGARGNVLREYPSVDVLDLGRGGRIDRLVRGATAIDFLGAVYGAESEGDAFDKPTGDDATEPFRWLAWANARYRAVDAESGNDAVNGYTWCLRRADDHRPGFRERYIEFLLKRIASSKLRAPTAVNVLVAERSILAGRLRQGTATRRDVYDLTRVDFWLRDELGTRDLYVELGKGGEKQGQYRRWLFPTVLPALGRFQQYEEILDVVGDDPVGMFRARIAALQVPDAEAILPGDAQDPAESPREDPAESAAGNAAGNAAGEGEHASDPNDGPLAYSIPDTRGDIIDGASWVYEALLASGKGADARALFEFLKETYPLPRTYALFMERALRLEYWSLATEIADIGMSVVDAKGQKRLQRLLNKIPVDDDDGGTDR